MIYVKRNLPNVKMTIAANRNKEPMICLRENPIIVAVKMKAGRREPDSAVASEIISFALFVYTYNVNQLLSFLKPYAAGRENKIQVGR